MRGCKTAARGCWSGRPLLDSAPMLVRARLVFAALLAAGVGIAQADDAAPAAPMQTPPSTAPAQPAAPTQTTEVAGTVPDLTGRWFVRGSLSINQGEGQPAASVTVPAVWTVTSEGGRQQITMRFVKLPPAVQQAMDAANEKHVAWTPTLADLQAVQAEWERLPADDRGVATVKTRLVGHDAFDETITSDEHLKDGQWAVVQVTDYLRGVGRPLKEIQAYAATQRTERGWSGSFLSSTIAAAPFIVPITFRGTFDLYRLDDLPPPGLLQRIMGVFAGCGRGTRS